MRSLLLFLTLITLCGGIGLVIFHDISSTPIKTSNTEEPEPIVPEAVLSSIETKQSKHDKEEPKQTFIKGEVLPAEPKRNLPTPSPVKTEKLFIPPVVIQEILSPPTPSDNIEINKPSPKPGPLAELETLFNAKKYQELVQAVDDRDWHPFNDQAREYRAAATIAISQSLIKNGEADEAIFLLEQQLNITSNWAGVYSMLAKAYTEKGNINKALSVLQQGSVVISDREQAQKLDQQQLNIVDQHIAFLVKNEHWYELIKFIENEPLPGSEKYYHYKLSLARAYIQLFDLDKAEEQLNLAAFNPDLEPEIKKLQLEIDKIRAEILAEQQKSEPQFNEDEMIIPIRVKGDAIYVNVLLNEKVKANLLLDTGASITHLSTSIMNKLGSSGITSDGYRVFITASGRMKAPVGYLDLAQMEDTGVTNLLVAFSDIFSKDSGVDGLLGMNFLRFYNFSFDFDQQVLILKNKNQSN